MTLPSNSRVSTKYTANGTNKDFAYNFRVFYSSDTGTYGIEVRKVVEGGYEIVSPALYEVIPDDSTLIGGKIRYFTAPVAGTELYVAGKTPKVQQLNLANYGRFSAESIEANFDFMMAIIQEWLSSLDEEKAQRIANDLLVNENTAALYANWQSWAETNVPVFAETFLTAELSGFKQQWIDALNQITLTSIPALAVPTSSGQNQQQINDSTGAKWYAKVGGYDLHDRVTLLNGLEVKSTIPANTNNPNSNMTGWILTNSDNQLKTWSGGTQEQKNKEKLSLADFGYIGDGTLHPLSEFFATLAQAQAVFPSATALSNSTDTVAVQKAIDYCKARGKTTHISVPAGLSFHNKEIVWKNYAFFEGLNFHDTVFKKAAGYNGRLIVSENFDSIKGTDASLTGLPIINFGIVNIKLDGNYIQSDVYVNNFNKGCLFIYGTKYTLIAKIINTDGVGVWLEYGGSEDFDNDVIRDAKIDLIIFDTGEEGLIFKGAPDIIIDKIIQKGAGKITSTDPRNYTLWSSTTYPALGRLDGIVFEKGAEIGTIHAFGDSVGYGVRLEGGRINANLIISESVLGGIDVYATVYGLISKLQVHNVKGGVAYVEPPHVSAGTFANVDIKSTAGLVIGELRSDHSGSGQTGQNHLHLRGFQTCISVVRVNGFGKGGHAIYSDTTANGNSIGQYIVNNIVGASGFDAAESAALVRNSGATNRQNSYIGGNVANCPTGLRTIGTNPVLERIEMIGAGITTPFQGVAKTNDGQKWDIGIIDGSSNLKGTKYSGSASFNPTLTTTQSIVLNHNLLYNPQFKDVSVSMSDTPTGLAGGEVQFMYVTSTTNTTITVAVKMKVANGSDTGPLLVVRAEI